MRHHQAPGAAASADFRAVYRTTLPDVYGYLLGLVGGNRTLADDLLAETYLSAADRFAHSRGHEVTVPWLKVVAKRRFIDHIRRESSIRRRVDKLQIELTTSDARRSGGSADHADHVADRDAVFGALGKLTEEQRLVLIMKHVDGFSTRQIAAQIDRTPKAVEGLLGRARAAFRDVFEATDA